MINLYKFRNWFTLAETMIVCSLFAIMVLWIILGINRAYLFLDDTRLSVRASNFAREWVETIYNIRDSHWRQAPSEKDKRRLYVWWSENHIFEPWIYVLEQWIDGDLFNYAYKLNRDDGINTLEDEDLFYSVDGFFSWAYDTAKDKARLTFTWNYYYLSWTDISTWSMSELLWSWADFYRVVRVYGIFCKDTADPNRTNSCTKDSDPKELRFCVKVFYDSKWLQNARELCSIMTNFME